MTRRAQPWPVGLGLGLALLFAACSGPQIPPHPRQGRCAEAEPLQWATLASAAIHVVPFQSRSLYDLDAKDQAVPFLPGPCVDCVAVVSWPAPTREPGGPEGFERLGNRSFVYDNALTALLRVDEGKTESARHLLDTLVALQRSDGAWGFSFALRDDGYYNAGYIRTGTVAWVLTALAAYERIVADGRYLQAMRRAGGWLAAQRDPVSGLLRGGRGEWVNDGAQFRPDHEVGWASTEHNIDAAFALRAAAMADPAFAWLDAEALARAIETKLFLADEGRYSRGLQANGPDRTVALDAAGTWSALFEVARGRGERARALLGFVGRTLGIVLEGWRVLRPGDTTYDEVWFVEGSVARAMVLARLGDMDAARRDLVQLAQWACVGGVPLLYASSWVKDFPKSPAVAPTVWFVLAAREFEGLGSVGLWRASLRP